jgi:hypothetical protein
VFVSPVFRCSLPWAIGIASALAGCQADVSLGRWGRGPSPTVVVGDASPDTSSVVGEPSALPVTPVSPAPELDASLAAEAGVTQGEATSADTELSDASVGNSAPACLEQLGAGMRSTLGDGIAVTETSTDWSLPEPTTGMEWTLTIEREVPPVTPETVGYYWHNQFSFVPGIAGRIGFQAEGFYDPKTGAPGSTEYTRMVVFWLSGPPLDAELGDIPFPDARVATESAVGLDWQTIHAKFDWQVCHTYRFRVDIESTEANGNMWYGAWITDETDSVVTFLGRMLMPQDVGLLSTLSSTRTSPIRFGITTSCDQLYQTSAIFGAPTSVDGQRSVRVADHFFQPYGCRQSLIADYDDAVRHQLSVPAQ